MIEYFLVDAAKLKYSIISSEMLGLGGVGPSFLHDFLLTFCEFLIVV